MAPVVRAILEARITAPTISASWCLPELLAEQKRTEHLFNAVMVAIASISLLVGGIGIMNIMLASILERTREIGCAALWEPRQSDIVRQFVVEATMISFAGGTIGVVFGFFISRLIAWLAGWSTIVTFSSIAIGVSRLHFRRTCVWNLSRATKAARLDPVEAIR